METVLSDNRLASNPLIDSCPEFGSGFDDHPFEFFHKLSDHPLFRLERLLQLAKSTAENRPDDLYYDMGEIRIDQRWDLGPRHVTVEKALENIGVSGVWVILKHPERDPEYKALLNECMAAVNRYIGRDLGKELRVPADSILFISSPNRITSYHIDRECSFLMQIQGEKEINIFDRKDREVLTEEELEQFWSVDTNAARYKQHLQERARIFQLRPGNGVHIPVNFPHWVKNGNNVSISYNINCQFKDNVRASLYRANYALRRLGITPTPPGQSRLRDGLKKTLIGGVAPLRRALRRVSFR
jgi:hypothetical protein